MLDNSYFDRVARYIDDHYVERAVDFVCDEVTDHTQDDPEDPFATLSESVSCRYVLEGEEEDTEGYSNGKKAAAILEALDRKLPLMEFESFLGKEGFRLSRSSKEDLVISFCLQNGIHDPVEINDLLHSLSLPLLSQAI